MALRTGIPVSELKRTWTIEDFQRAVMVTDARNRDAAYRAGVKMNPHPAREWDLSDLDEAEREARTAKRDAEYAAHRARYTIAFQNTEDGQ